MNIIHSHEGENNLQVSKLTSLTNSQHHCQVGKEGILYSFHTRKLRNVWVETSLMLAQKFSLFLYLLIQVENSFSKVILEVVKDEIKITYFILLVFYCSPLVDVRVIGELENCHLSKV